MTNQQRIFEVGVKLGNWQQTIDYINFHSTWEWLGEEGLIDILDRMIELWMEYEQLIREDNEVGHTCCICRDNEATIPPCP